jgi:hypothetical protein
MRFKPLLVITLFISACAALPFPGMSGGAQSQTQATKTETQSSSQTEEMHVNGKPVSVADRDDGDDDAPRAKKKSSKGDIGKTCHHNNECAADACYVGAGELGYCTKMCNSWSECPTHWECKRAQNAPQKICMQDAD